jgi:hypothetical protein
VSSCPRCGGETAGGASACNACGEPLPGESGRGSHGGWDQVVETKTALEAELVALRLRSAGIEADILDQTFRQEPLPAVRAFSVVRVLVPTGRAAEARRLLEEPVGLPEDADSDESGAATCGPSEGRE